MTNDEGAAAGARVRLLHARQRNLREEMQACSVYNAGGLCTCMATFWLGDCEYRQAVRAMVNIKLGRARGEAP